MRREPVSDSSACVGAAYCYAAILGMDAAAVLLEPETAFHTL